MHWPQNACHCTTYEHIRSPHDRLIFRRYCFITIINERTRQCPIEVADSERVAVHIICCSLAILLQKNSQAIKASKTVHSSITTWMHSIEVNNDSRHLSPEGNTLSSALIWHNLKQWEREGSGRRAPSAARRSEILYAHILRNILHFPRNASALLHSRGCHSFWLSHIIGDHLLFVWPVNFQWRLERRIYLISDCRKHFPFVSLILSSMSMLCGERDDFINSKGRAWIKR